jgi:uncharacterized cupredoxin-like copper-binding protein
MLALAALAVAGCSTSGDSSQAGPGERTVVERDFKISAPRHLPAGDVTFLVRNRGPVAHELIVARGRRGSLPFRADGITVDEDAIESRKAGALEPGETGAVRTLDVKLTPGRYVMFCNMSGHLLGGMHTELVVN